MLKRLWIYQRERFPLGSHGLLIAAFSTCAIAFSAFARGASLPNPWLLVAGFTSSLCFFAQLRIADEWKDAAEDAAFRPYRPVPRGLVTLGELAWVGVAAGVLQLAIAFAITPRLVALLLGVWGYFALMSREFFVGRWLRAHPVAYIVSHMAIMPMIDGYVCAFDWLVARQPASHALFWFLGVTLWGRSRAAGLWCAAFTVTAVLATIAASRITFAGLAAGVFGVAILIAARWATAYVCEPNRRHAKRIEQFSGAWTVMMYLTLGLAPYVSKALSAVVLEAAR
jgi:4-hydroxybenzoate polyprenyltransferase